MNARRLTFLALAQRRICETWECLRADPPVSSLATTGRPQVGLPTAQSILRRG